MHAVTMLRRIVTGAVRHARSASDGIFDCRIGPP